MNESAMANDGKKAARNAVMVMALMDVMSGGEFSSRLFPPCRIEQRERRSPCDSCLWDKTGNEAICRSAAKELYQGYDIRIRTCSAYRKAQEG